MYTRERRVLRNVFITCCVLLCISISVNVGLDEPAKAGREGIRAEADGFGQSQDGDEFNILHVPYERQRINLGGSAPASLAMIFDYYGAWVHQMEIEPAVNTSGVPGVGTAYEGFLDGASYDNYSSRDWGFTVEILELDALTQEQRHEFLKEYINNEIPVIVICKLTPSRAPHYKVLIGYDEANDRYYFNDPWYTPDGASPPDPCGPFSVVSAYEGETSTRFELTWANSENRIAVVRPIGVDLSLDDFPVPANTEFELNCTISLEMFASAQNVELELMLPEGYSIENGELMPELLGVSGEATYTWTLSSPVQVLPQDYIEVVARTIGTDPVYGGVGRVYPAAPPAPTIEEPAIENEERVAPAVFSVESMVSYSQPFNVSMGIFNQSDTGQLTFFYETVGENTATIDVFLHSHFPGKVVFFWVEVESIFGRYWSSIIVVDIVDGDLDGDGIPDYYELVLHGTNPFEADSDFDDLDDYSEIFTYFTNPWSSDSDSDNLNDSAEVLTYGTNPLSSDSDMDLQPDDYEVRYGLNPNFNDAEGDLDGDSLTNLQEYYYGTDPTSRDSDMDGMEDAREIELGYDPLDPESNDSMAWPEMVLPPVIIGSIAVVLAVIAWRFKNS